MGKRNKRDAHAFCQELAQIYYTEDTCGLSNRVIAHPQLGKDANILFKGICAVSHYALNTMPDPQNIPISYITDYLKCRADRSYSR